MATGMSEMSGGLSLRSVWKSIVEFIPPSAGLRL